MKRSALIITASFALLAGQSFFNMRGLGELTPLADARAASLANPAALSLTNPGIVLNLSKTNLSLTMLGAGTYGTQEGSGRLIGNIRPAGFHVAVPLPTKSRLLAGIDQRFSQDFDVWSESLSGTNYRYHVVGKGGIYNFRAGLAQALFDRFCLGLEYHRLVGGSHENWQFRLTEGGSSSTDTIEIDYSAGTIRAGASFQTRLFSLAATYEPGFSMTCHRFKRVHGVVTDSVRIYQVRLPHTILLGIGISPIERLAVSTGLELRPWSRATINDTPVSDFRNGWRGSVGAEYELFPNYSVRLGYSHQTWYYDVRPSTLLVVAPIQEHGLHLGTSIPIPKFGSLDLSGELLFRNSSNLSETAGRLMLSLVYFETWAKRTRRWGY